MPAVFENDAIFANKHNINFKSLQTEIPQESIKAEQNKVCEKAKQLNVGGYWTSAKLRDWLISRQRYWGTPIPIVHCKTCGTQPVSRQDLPVKLPKLTSLSQKGRSHLSECEDWLYTKCPKCGEQAERETDTMDTFVDSSWYYLRYLDPDNRREMFDVEKAKKMLPVDLYIGGKEHG